jgi:hypothetical protein
MGEKQNSTERAVEKKGQQVGTAESWRAKQAQGEHRRERASLDEEKYSERDDSRHTEDGRGFNKCAHDASKTKGGQKRTTPVECRAFSLRAALRNTPDDHGDHGERDRTLIKNTQRHEACCTNQPPATGPIAVVMVLKPDQVPMARPRSSGENEVAD